MHGLPNPTGNNFTEHYACDGDPGCAEVVAGGTHKTFRNNCSFGYEGFDGQVGEDVNERVLWVIMRRVSPGPSGFASEVEDGKPHCRIEMCGVAPFGNHGLFLVWVSGAQDGQARCEDTGASAGRCEISQLYTLLDARLIHVNMTERSGGSGRCGALITLADIFVRVSDLPLTLYAILRSTVHVCGCTCPMSVLPCYWTHVN